jgi:hypothetical protein
VTANLLAGVILSLAAGVAASSWFAIAARKEAGRATQEQKKSQQETIRADAERKIATAQRDRAEASLARSNYFFALAR